MGGIIVGEAGSQWELKEEERKAEIELMEKEIRKAKECIRAVKKIAALRQKEWESARDYGKRAEKLQAKLPDASEEPWLVECFINGIYGRCRRRRVCSQFRKTDENVLSLKTTIDNLRHWRRLPKEYADHSESESDDENTRNDESDSDASGGYETSPLRYVLVDTISPTILSDADAYDKFLEDNNLIPKYPLSGPYSFGSIMRLQETAIRPSKETVGIVATNEIEAQIEATNTGTADEDKDSTSNERDTPGETNDWDDVQPMQAIPEQIATCPGQLSGDRQMSQLPVLCSSRQWDMFEGAVGEGIRKGFGMGVVYRNATGENKREKWREKLQVGEELEKERAIAVMRSDTGMHFQEISCSKPSTLDERCRGIYDGEGGLLRTSTTPEDRQTWDNAVELVDTSLQEIHSAEWMSTTMFKLQTAGREQRKTQVLQPLLNHQAEAAIDPMRWYMNRLDDYCVPFGWPPAKNDIRQTYRKSLNALSSLNRRLEKAYSVRGAYSGTTGHLTAAVGNCLQPVPTSCQVICHERAPMPETIREYDQKHQRYDFATTCAQSIKESLTDEDTRTVREREPGGTGRIVVRLPAAKTEIGVRTAEAVAMDSGTGDLKAEQKERGLQVVEERTQGWRKQEDGRCTGLSLQGLSYRDRQSWKIGANGKHALENGRSAEVAIAAACGDASTWVFGMSCGGKLQIRGIMGIVAVTWMWDPGGGALDILAFVLLPAGT